MTAAEAHSASLVAAARASAARLEAVFASVVMVADAERKAWLAVPARRR